MASKNIKKLCWCIANFRFTKEHLFTYKPWVWRHSDYFFQEFWYCLRNFLHYTDPKIWEDPDFLNTRGSVELFKYAFPNLFEILDGAILCSAAFYQNWWESNFQKSKIAVTSCWARLWGPIFLTLGGLDILFFQIRTFLKACVTFVFGLQTL